MVFFRVIHRFCFIIVLLNPAGSNPEVQASPSSEAWRQQPCPARSVTRKNYHFDKYSYLCSKDIVFFITFAVSTFCHMELTIYDVIKAAYRSRLLARTDAEFRNLVGVSFETISDRRNDENAISYYYDILTKECHDQCEQSLYAMVASYIRASEASSGAYFDWRERRQLASRKKFCRWLFRKGAAPGRRMSVEEELKFSPKDCDHALFDSFYPEGIEAGRSVDIIFLLLITFGIIKPLSLSARRSRDISDIEAARSAMALKNLILQLRDDMPQIGVLPKPLAFDTSIEYIDQSELSGFRDYTIARIWHLLDSVEDACLALSSPQKASDSKTEFSGYSMPGIWVDDTDEGRTRFWIFPENKLMAFCYQKYYHDEWHLIPYEFAFLKNKNKNAFSDSCLFISAEGNRQILSDAHGVMSPSEAVLLSYRCGLPDYEYGTFSSINFEFEAGKRPLWYDWNSFTRLYSDDPRNIEFLQVISDIYNPDTIPHMLFKNAGPFMTDSVDAIIGMDNDFLYVSDMSSPAFFLLTQYKEAEGQFWYEPRFLVHPNLRNVIISDKHPLYIVPRTARLDHPLNERHRRFAEAVANIGINDQVTICRTEFGKEGILVFNKFSQVFRLSELEAFGVVRITHRSQLWN